MSRIPASTAKTVPAQVTQARRIAFDVLCRVETQGAYAADLLHSRLEKRNIRREDAALATELTFGVLRWQRLLDFLIDRHSAKPATHLDTEVRIALRLGFYQLRFLTRVPAHAAVNESVELVKGARKRSAAGLVNALLRRGSETARQPAEELVPEGLPVAERLGILHSHLTWMVARWLEGIGEARTVALLEANNRPPNIACAVHDLSKRAEIEVDLKEAGISVEAGRLLRAALIARGGNPANTEAFRRGWISIQDEASQIVPLLLDVREGNAVLDLCAAPGGKAMSLARAAGAGSLVIAADLHPHRLRALREQLRRVGADHVHFLALDATLPLPFPTLFDRILVDVPCSGTGTLARNPEIRWRIHPEDLTDFEQRQAALLANALDRLAPGGRLVYSTCSLEPEENEQVIDTVLKLRRNIRIVRAADALRPYLADGVSAESLLDTSGYFRTFPPEHHADGFFAAVLERQGHEASHNFCPS